MESTPHRNPFNLSVASTPGSRKRDRENETPSQRHKREKAAERQRRKRERDRNNNSHSNNNNPEPPSAGSNGMNGIMFPQPGEHQQHQQVQHAPPPPDYTGQDLSSEEVARRERVRASARERQKKHRALVKERKMRELGLDMGNELPEVQYRVNGEGQYQPVSGHDLQHTPHTGIVQHEPPFPDGHQQGGQMFASTLLLSFSCAPLLKQNLLRTLSMTNEELASLEPIIAEAWEHWEHQRRMHYAQQAADAAKASGQPSLAGPSSYSPADPRTPDGHSASFASSQHQPSSTDFRTRFQRSMVVPSPFRTFAADSHITPPSTTTSNASGPSSDGIDPHLSDRRHNRVVSSDLGQARSEAEGVVGRLERA